MGDRGTIQYNETIYEQKYIIVKQDQSKLKSSVIYRVNFSIHAYENGDVSVWKDDRSCHFDPSPREFTRDLVVNHDNGTTTSLGSMKLAAPAMGSKSWDDPCTDHMPSDYEAFFREMRSDIKYWQPYIDKDLPNVEEILKLMGSVQRL